MALVCDPRTTVWGFISENAPVSDMELFSTVKKTLAASTQSTDRGKGTNESKGAYWCHDCAERIPDFEVDGEATPDCPECGDAMAFERSPGSTGCAC
jgi:Zn finger protein HypA/HybF involved in hydrogenase expression